MKRNIFASVILTLSLISLQATASESVQYLFGDFDIFVPATPSPILVKQKVSLVKRIVSPERGQILEIVTQADKGNQINSNTIETTMTRIGSSNQFQSTDGHSFDGTMNFYGDDWNWTGWDYNIILTENGDSFTGTATLTVAGLKTDKLISSANGTLKFIIKEDLKTINEDKYKEQYNRMTDGEQK